MLKYRINSRFNITILFEKYTNIIYSIDEVNSILKLPLIADFTDSQNNEEFDKNLNLLVQGTIRSKG